MENQGQQGFSFGELLKRLTVLIKPHKKRAVIVAVLLLATLGLELAQPLIIGAAVNAVKEGLTTPELKDGALKRVAYFGGLLLAASALRCVMMFVTGVEQTHLTQNILWTLRRRLYDAMQRLSFSFFDNAQSGQLISRSTSDVQRVARFFNAAFFSSIEALTILIGISIYMFYTSPLLAVVALAPMPFTFLVVIRAAIKIRPLFREARDSYGAVTSALQENIAGIKVVRAFAQEEQEIARFGDIAETFIGKLLSAIDRWAVRMPLAMFIYRLSGPLVLLMGGYLVMKGPRSGGIEVGVLFAFILYSRLMMYRVHMVGNIVSATTRASAAAERIYEVLETDPDVAESHRCVEIPEGDGEVVFENVTFAYNEGKPVLHEINLRVLPGQMVALVGHTGAGKTSLVNLIPRFYDVSEGAVFVDGVNVRDMRLSSLRRNVSLIFQETFLFSVTIAENIAYARPDAGREDVERCARAAQAHEFIQGLDEGYDTVIGERGVTLSGGQRQRVAIARALLADPRILIMDDATASVDSATERQIQEALLELSRGRTTFVIAHRVSTVRRADVIVVLEAGRIVEMGTHQELLEHGGVYRGVYDVQLADAVNDVEGMA